MKKICFFVGNSNHSGGTERVSSVIINKLSQLSYDVHIINLNGGDKPFFKLDDNVKTFSLDNVPGGSITSLLKSIRKLRRYLSENKINRVIAVESILSIYAIPAVFLLPVKLIVWEHFNFHVDLGVKARNYARRLAAFFADSIITLTEKDKGFWQAEAKCRANVICIPNPVPFELPNSDPSLKNKTFLAVGRLTYQKGFDLLIDAWKESAVSELGWSLQIVGSGEDLEVLDEQCKALGIKNSVQFIPATPHIKTYYQNATFYVMSSRFEGLPMVLLEAAAYGLPMISFDCDTGPSDVIDNSINGWLCQPNNIISLCDAIKDAVNVSEDNTHYKKLSNEAKKIAKKYTIEPIITKWVKVIEGTDF